MPLPYGTSRSQVRTADTHAGGDFSARVFGCSVRSPVSSLGLYKLVLCRTVTETPVVWCAMCMCRRIHVLGAALR